MVRKKILYEQPSCELLIVRFEECILSGDAGGDDTIVDDPDDY